MKIKLAIVFGGFLLAITGCSGVNNSTSGKLVDPQAAQKTAPQISQQPSQAPGSQTPPQTAPQASDSSFDETKAVAKVVKDHPEYPELGAVKKVEAQSGGPAPGVKVNGEFTTKAEKSAEKDTYVITFTKEWNVMMNNKKVTSFWKYKVTPNNIQLMASEDNDKMLESIK